MKYLHTMIRVGNLDKSLDFYVNALGFALVRKNDYPKDRFTLAFLAPPGGNAESPLLELTHNWDTPSYDRGDGYGHVAFEVASIEEIQRKVQAKGYDLSWGPGATPSGNQRMAFIDDPDGYEIELLEKT